MEKSPYYILEGKEPKQTSASEWAKWFENAERSVAHARNINTGVRVSTVFLGLNHRHGDGEPLLFETMVFGGKHDGHQERYSTYTQAEDGHAKICEMVFPITNLP